MVRRLLVHGGLVDGRLAVMPRLSPGVRRVLLAGAVMAAAATYLLLAVLPHEVTRADLAAATPWLLLLAFGLSEIVVIHAEIGDNAYSLSVSEVPFVLGLFLLPPPLLVLVRVVGGGLALRFHRRQRWFKLAFNLSQWALEAVAGILVFRLFRVGTGATWDAWGAATASTMTAALVATTAVLLAIRLTAGAVRPADARRWLAAGLVNAAATATVATVAVAAIRGDRAAAWPLLAAALVFALGYRSYARLRSRHASLNTLYEFSRSLEHTGGGAAMLPALLDRLRELLRAEVAELVVLSQDGRNRRTTLAGPDAVTSTFVAAPADAPWVGVVAGRNLHAPANTRDPQLRAYLAHRDVRDLVVVPLRLDGGEVIATILVANRTGDVATFTTDDVRLLETVSTQLAIALHNAHLMEQLHHESLHDALTGLANRSMFQRSCQVALTASPYTSVAVLLMDLDRFKEVNDTLGHHHGDLLLGEVSQRFVQAVGSRGLVARLGGDEFAVLLPGGGEASASGLAAELLDVLAEPVVLEGVALHIGGSIGIALAPEHGRDASTLLQRADMAMYVAKDMGTRCEFYSGDRDEYTPRRLALANQLRSAIDNGQLVLHYQPQADALTGVALGVEALVRWQHETYGLIPPDEFVAVAEQTGQIQPLTRWVLRETLAQRAAWAAAGIVLDVAVNVSVRSLLDQDLPDYIDALLAEYAVPPPALRLEITESHIMADPERIRRVLDRLTQNGTQLSIDDFGTGYSSLAYLKQLPVSEVKIDREFVRQLSSGSSDEAIVRAIVNLAHGLGLSVVAEGVEDADAWDVLAGWNCDRIQGYFLSKPMDGRQVADWLDRHRARILAAADPDAKRRAGYLLRVVGG